MQTIEKLRHEVDEALNDPQTLELVHQMLQKLKQNQQPKPTLMAQLRSIKKIDAPEDFATNLDAYLNGEKQF